MTGVVRGPLQQYAAGDVVKCRACDWQRVRLAPSTARRAATRHVQETGHTVVRQNPRGQLYAPATEAATAGTRARVVAQ